MTLPWKARLCSSQNFGLCSIGATLLRMWEGEGEPLPLLPIPPQQAPTPHQALGPDYQWDGGRRRPRGQITGRPTSRTVDLEDMTWRI